MAVRHRRGRSPGRCSWPGRGRGARCGRSPAGRCSCPSASGVWYVTNSATYYAGITTVPLGLAALIIYIYPPVVAVLALRLGRPLEGRRAWTALAIAVLGVALAVGGIDTTTAPPLEGLLLIIASPLVYAVWIIMAARHSGERSDRTGHEADDGASTSVIGAVMLTSTAAVYWVVNLAIGHPVLPPDIPGPAWPGIIAVALVAGFVPMQAFYAGAQRVGAAQASLISTVEPLWTIVAAALLFGERLQPVQLARRGADPRGRAAVPDTRAGRGPGRGARTAVDRPTSLRSPSPWSGWARSSAQANGAARGPARGPGSGAGPPGQASGAGSGERGPRRQRSPVRRRGEGERDEASGAGSGERGPRGGQLRPCPGHHHPAVGPDADEVVAARAVGRDLGRVPQQDPRALAVGPSGGRDAVQGRA